MHLQCATLYVYIIDFPPTKHFRATKNKLETKILNRHTVFKNPYQQEDKFAIYKAKNLNSDWFKSLGLLFVLTSDKIMSLSLTVKKYYP